MTNKTLIDLFCGAGGLSDGFRQAGYDVLVGNDIDIHAGETFKQTHPEATFLHVSIEELSATDFLIASGLKTGELYCLAGGPPCQAYSVYNHQRGMHDERSTLFKEYLRIVKGLQPEWIVLENVTGILSVGKGQAVTAILKGLKQLGYHVEFNILRAEDFGVPQERRRVVFIGNRTGKKILWPKPTHGRDLQPFVTVCDAIGDLPILENGEDSGPTEYNSAATSEYQQALRGNNTIVFNHAAPKLAPINLKRMKHIPQGGSWRDIPIALLPAGMKRARRCDHTKRYGRLNLDGLASTILTKCDLHWGAYIHPTQNRALTVREAARFQSFADNYIFSGPRTEQFVQVGNAVPPLLANAIAKAMITSEQSISGEVVARHDKEKEQVAATV